MNTFFVLIAAAVGFCLGHYSRGLFAIARRAYQQLPSVKARDAKVRRERYDLIKAQIAERHFGGYAGLVCDFVTIDAIDRACFKPPMYGWAQNQKMEWCVFWDRNRLTQEIGVGSPLREGEVVSPQPNERVWKQTDPEKVDEQKPLTQRKEGSPDGTNV